MQQLDLSESEVSLIISTLESWLDEYSYAKYEPIKYTSLATRYAKTEQLARKLGWKPRGES